MAKRKIKRKKNKTKKRSWIPAPLPTSFILTAILGFVISAWWVFPESFNWGIAFMILFTLMFITSIINMTKAPAVPQYKELKK